MKANIRVPGYLVLFLAILSIAGCKSANPVEPKPVRRLLDLDAIGDMPLYIEYSYESADNGKVTGSVTTSSTSWTYGWDEVNWANQGSSYRLYAISKVPNGHVRAYVDVYDNYSEFGGKSLLYKGGENDGGAVEITGIVP
jgi:hypothetical protein